MLFKVSVQRGKLTESIHTAKCLVKNSNSKTILSSGHSKELIYPAPQSKYSKHCPSLIQELLKSISCMKKI